MIRSVLVLGLLAFSVGCSSAPDVVEEDARGDEMAMEGSDSSLANQEADIIADYGNVTQLDDERVSDSLIIVDDERVTRGNRQDETNPQVVIAQTRTVFQDIYFDFDRRIPQKRMLKRLTAQAEWLRNHADAEVLVAGHCDTRGSREYNVVLGEKRAQWIKSFFMKSGVNGERVAIISYGKEQPNCLVETKACHSKNRRAQIALQ